jgi:hypothetical protein
MPTHLGGDYEQTPYRSMEDHLATAGRLATEHLRVKGSSFVASTDRKTSLLRDRPAEGVRSSAPYRIWVSDAAHHCIQLRVDLLFTMSDNLHRVIEDRRDTNFKCMDEFSPPSLRFGVTAFAQRAGSPSRSAGGAKAGGARRDRTDDLLLAKQALSQLSYGPGWNASRLKGGGPGKTRTSDLTLIKRAL